MNVDPYGLIGQVLDGQFRVDKFVGEGGFSAVYRGHHLGLDEPIAVKCLKLPGALGSALVESFVRRFRDESRLHYRLSQGNLAIVRSIASGTTMSPSTSALVPYMVLEWLEGRSLAQELEARRTQGLRGRSVDEMVKLLDSAAQGLAFAHAQGVVHRDVNPGNLFLAQTRQGQMTKVLDFGVAKVVSDHALELGPRAQTIGQIRIFAPAYGSPEQFDDSVGKVGAASDVYSLAVIALELLRDVPVREGEHLGEFAMKALDPVARTTPRSLGVPVGDAVEEVFARATTLRPEDRLPDAGSMWGALKHAIRVDAESGKAPHADLPPSRAMGWRPHAPAAGQPAPDRPVTADMPAPVVEVARVGSIVSPSVPNIEPSRAMRPQSQTVRMTAADVAGVSAPIVASGASALGATPLTSTLMMDGAQRILTPIPPTTRTGEPPAVSIAVAPAPSMPRSELASTRPLPGANPSPLPAGYGAAEGAPLPPIPAPAALPMAPPPLAPAPVAEPPRAEVPTIIPPKPPSRAIAIAVAIVAALVFTLLAFAAYRLLSRASSPPLPASGAPTATSTSSTTSATAPAPVPLAPTPVATTEPAAAVPATSAAEPLTASTPAAPTHGSNGASASSTPVSSPASAPVLASAAGPRAFDPAAALHSLDVMNGVLASCRRSGGKTGDGPISVTFDPSGKVSRAVVEGPPFLGTPEGDCAASRLRQAKVPPFEGAPGTVNYTFHIPQ